MDADFTGTKNFFDKNPWGNKNFSHQDEKNNGLFFRFFCFSIVFPGGMIGFFCPPEAPPGWRYAFFCGKKEKNSAPAGKKI